MGSSIGQSWDVTLLEFDFHHMEVEQAAWKLCKPYKSHYLALCYCVYYIYHQVINNKAHGYGREGRVSWDNGNSNYKIVHHRNSSSTIKFIEYPIFI